MGAQYSKNLNLEQRTPAIYATHPIRADLLRYRCLDSHRDITRECDDYFGRPIAILGQPASEPSIEGLERATQRISRNCEMDKKEFFGANSTRNSRREVAVAMSK